MRAANRTSPLPEPVIAVALALSASLAWGIADFLGGLQSRRHPVFAVVLFSQLGGLVLAVGAVGFLADGWPGLRSLLPAGVAGLVGAVALAAFYQALALGTMGIVAPIVATSAVVPVLVGLVAGERPSAVQLAGMLLAAGGVVVAAREPAGSEPSTAAARRSIALALVAALMLGLTLVGLREAAQGEPFWAVLAARSVSLACLAGFLVVRVQPLRVRPSIGPRLAIIGVLDTGSNLLFALASTYGLLSAVAVLSSLYPVVTVLLARGLLGERMAALQVVGVAAALVGVVLIGAG